MSSGSISQRVRTGGADPSSDAGGDEGLLQRIIDAIPAPVFFKDAECRYIGCNEAFARGVMGSAPADIAGKGVHDIAPAELARVYEAADRALLAEGGSQMYETQVRFTDGGYRDIAFHKAVFPDLSGNPGGIVGVMLDITERKRHEARLAEREQMFRSVFDASEDAMLIYDEGRLVDCNPATVRMLRCPSREWVINREPAALSPTHQPDGRASREKAAEMVRTAFERHFHRFEWVHRRADGEAFPCEVTLTTMTLGGRKVLHVVWNDITERRRRERQIEALANYDPLTGLANRRLLRSRGHALLARARREGAVGVMYMDLNRFKDINDTQGHDLGDALLRQVAERLRACSEGSGLLARLGGDEFAVLLPDAGMPELRGCAERVLAAFEEPFRVRGVTARLGTSIGLVTYPRDGDSLTELLKHADIAMYAAKSDGHGYAEFSPAQARRVHARVDLEHELREAISRGDITLHYQPRVNIATGAVEAVEALARWHRGSRDDVPPAQFIAAAEDAGLVHFLDRQLIRACCRQLRGWRERGLTVMASVNVSALTLEREDFAAMVLAALEAAGLPGEALEVEITESAAMRDPEANTRKLAELKGHGVRVAIDDFGTGYSSLSYLKRLPVDCLKVDQSFVRDIPGDPMDAGLVETIVALARSMRLTTVAEGVESATQLAAVRDLGCEAAQGFLFARPAAADELETVLATGRVPLPTQ